MRNVVMLVVVSFTSFGRVAMADLKQDFEQAKSQNGCDSIPYANLRSRCRDSQRDVEQYCKTDKVSCKGLDIEPLENTIEGMKKKVDSLKRERDTAKRDKNDAEVRRIEQEIDALEKGIGEKKRRIDQDRREIDRRISQGERCIEARQRVEGIFKDARSEAKGEVSPEIKPIAQTLIRDWERGERGHTIAIENFKTAVSKCKDKR